MAEPWPVPGAVNGGCLDISKSRVEAAARAAFGYWAAVDPTRHDGPMVRKSEENAGKLGDLTEKGLRKGRRAGDRSAETGRKLHQKLPGD